MRNVPTSQLYYKTLSQANSRVNSVLKVASDRIGGILRSYGETIPRQYESLVVTQAGNIIQRVFTGSNRQAFGSDGITPLAPYPRTLNILLATIQAQVVRAHADFIEKQVPSDVADWLKGAQLPPGVSELRHAFPAEYDAAHTWIDPRGYQLSDRVWQTGNRTEARIHALLREGIRRQRASFDLQRDLEAFLLPSRKWRRTNAPYGRDASFDAMRLARTEISLAHSRATFASASANPFVDGMDWALSARHPKPDICDSLATIGMGGERLRPPYPLSSAPMVVQSSHPQCICNNRPAVTERRADVIAELRQMMIAAQPAPVTPLAPVFLQWLLGGLLGYAVNDWSDIQQYAF